MEQVSLKPFSRADTCAGIRKSIARMRDNIESISHTVIGSRRTLREAHEAMKGADDALARRFTERG